MSGYNDNLYLGQCYGEFLKGFNESYSAHQLNEKAAMRDVDQCHALSRGGVCQFYGPLRGKRTTQESFMQGRGHTLTECPDCEVRYLPESLFPQKSQATACYRTDLQPRYDRQPKSCNGLMETDVTQYRFSPQRWQDGYTGYDSVVKTNLQTKLGYYPQCEDGVCNGAESYGCKTSYGSYGSGRNFARYAM